MLDTIKKIMDVGEKCSTCGKFTKYSQDGASNCYSCSKFLCDECAKYSEECRHYYCKNCTETCSVCSSTVCASCIIKCDACGKKVCKDCISSEQCDGCGKKVCKSCQTYITAFSKYLCPLVKQEVMDKDLHNLCKKCLSKHDKDNHKYINAEKNESHISIFYDPPTNEVEFKLEGSRVLKTDFYPQKDEAIKSLRITASFLGFNGVLDVKLHKMNEAEKRPNLEYNLWMAEGTAIYTKKSKIKSLPKQAEPKIEPKIEVLPLQNNVEGEPVEIKKKKSTFIRLLPLIYFALGVVAGIFLTLYIIKKFNIIVH